MAESDTAVTAPAVPAPRSPRPPSSTPLAATQLASTSSPSPSSARSETRDRRRFDVVLRGYERTAVDEHLARCAEEAVALRHELAESERRRAVAEQHATATESENRTLRSEQPGAHGLAEEGFGFRAEKLMRLAEQEAGDVRASAAREAAALLEQARAGAEQHRHEVEQTLITRSALLDQQAAQRTVELQEREQQIAAQLTAAQADVEAMHEQAHAAAERHRQQAEAEAEAVRSRAAHDARRLRDQAEQEVARLGALRDGARAEITRLTELLTDGLGAAGGPDPTADSAVHRVVAGRAVATRGRRAHATDATSTDAADGEPAGRAVAIPAAGH